jgi:Domain of unknown function (DUF5666)
VIQEPVQPTSSPALAPTRTRPRDSLLIAIVVAVGLALAVVFIAMAQSPLRPETPLALVAGASPSADASAKPHGNGQGQKPDKANKLDQANGGKGNKGSGAPGRGPITIRSIAGSDLALGTEDGWSRTITVTSSTAITKGGQTVSIDALKVGDQIRFSQTRNADGTYAITAIVVRTPEAGGEVTAVDATTITVKGKVGATRVITVNGATVYKLGSAAGSKADVKVGVRVVAQGTVSGDTFTAITVRIQPAEIGGIVTGKTGDSITVKRGDGSTAVIHVTSKTTYEHKGKDAATLADVAVGDRVSAEGTVRPDGSIDATSVEGQAPKVKKPAPAASAAP